MWRAHWTNSWVEWLGNWLPKHISIQSFCFIFANLFVVRLRNGLPHSAGQPMLENIIVSCDWMINGRLFIVYYLLLFWKVLVFPFGFLITLDNEVWTMNHGTWNMEQRLFFIRFVDLNYLWFNIKCERLRLRKFPMGAPPYAPINTRSWTQNQLTWAWLISKCIPFQFRINWRNIYQFTTPQMQFCSCVNLLHPITYQFIVLFVRTICNHLANWDNNKMF